MDIDIGLAFNMATEEISRLTNDLLIYKTLNIQKDKKIQELEDKIQILEKDIENK